MYVNSPETCGQFTPPPPSAKAFGINSEKENITMEIIRNFFNLVACL